ncbi:Glutaredoxin [Alteromonadaceae bacterium Bs31]|nr:Glutaredoxin [Alteromonadaceae bacterium Bs31]
MKMFIVLVLLFTAVQFRDDISNLLNPPPDLSSFRGEVVLYSTTWCGYCKKARSLLQNSGVSFIEKDIEKSDSAAAEFQQLGGRGVPLVTINGAVLKGYDRSRILDLITAEL